MELILGGERNPASYLPGLPWAILVSAIKFLSNGDSIVNLTGSRKDKSPGMFTRKFLDWANSEDPP